MKKILISLALVAACVSVNAQTKKVTWAPAGDNIRTEWAEQVNPANPLPEYPRPQMVRSQWSNLNGLWDYAITKDADAFVSEGKILVPFCAESSLSGVGRRVAKDEVLCYTRKFTVPKAWKGKNVILHFGAVDWATEVIVNGLTVGKHTGGYTPFSFDITKYLTNKSTQTLTVKVKDATDDSWQPRGKQWNRPAGIWYTPVTGIWQTVWLEPVAAEHIDNYYVVSDLDAKTLTVTADVVAKDGDILKIDLLEGGMAYSAEKPSTSVIASVEALPGTEAKISLPEVKAWSPDSPYLYGIKLSLIRAGRIIDSVDGYTSVRKISVVRDEKGTKRMALNNEILFQFGPLDQGWWPDGLYTAPTDEALRFDVVKTKDFGFNMIRKHIKVEPARWYYWCDVEGILVWQDMPSIGDQSRPEGRTPEIAQAQRNRWVNDTFVGGTDVNAPQEWKDNYYKEWGEIIASVKNFQCIVIYVPFNEGWGQFDSEAAVDFTRAQDPTRLVNQSSGGNFHWCGDIIDVHHYPNPKINAYEGRFVNVLGEYGGIGYPVEGHLWQKDRNWGYVQYKSGDEVLKTYTEFAEELKPLVTFGCCAAVYTQTTDVEGEVNGIMTYDRKVIKMDQAKLSAVNKSVIASSPKK